MNGLTGSPELETTEFAEIRELVYETCGLNLHAGKEGLVRSRLAKRLRALGLSTYREYLDRVRHDAAGAELRQLIDALTTNKTSFFREARHFDYLRERILPALVSTRRPIRIWSAGCASGEEPTSIAIHLRESVPDLDRRDVRILATDISTRVLAQGRDGIYDEDALDGVPPRLLQTYFTCARADPPRAYRLSESVRGMIRYARLNLMEPWPMRGPFDVIFCRNVMIYFDKPTQERLVQRFCSLLAPGGHLFVGHSESMTGLRHDFRYVSPAVYVKPPDSAAARTR